MSSQIIIISKEAPESAKNNLSRLGYLLELETPGITYNAISCHPDIFFAPLPHALVVAPNLPAQYFSKLDNLGINYCIGAKPVGKTYPETAPYNAVITKKHFIHNLHHTDPLLHANCTGFEMIHVNQAYTRCNLISLDEKLFITSDAGIMKTLGAKKLHCHYFPPSQIRLPGFEHGFLGGACGVNGNTLYCCGSLKYHSWEAEFRKLVHSAGFSIAELYDGLLVDVGSILFL